MALLIKYLHKWMSFLRKQQSRKVNAATLIESIVASVIIIIIFTIASLTLNNVFESTVKNNTSRVQHRMNELSYLYLNQKITYPYREDFENWSIQLTKKTTNQQPYMLLEVTHTETKKSIIQKLAYVTGK